MFRNMYIRKAIVSSLQPTLVIQRTFSQTVLSGRSVLSVKPTFIPSPKLISTPCRYFSLPFIGSKSVPPTQQPAVSSLETTQSSTLDGTSEIFPAASVEPILTNEPLLADASPVLDGAIHASSAPAVTDIVHRLGDLKTYGLASDWTPVGWVQQALEYMHVNVGLPWWGSIILVTFALRTALLPLILRLQVHSAAFAQLRPEITKISQELKEARAKKNYMKAQEKAKQLQSLFKEHNIKPFKTMLMPLIQTPILISFFFAIRNLSYAEVPSFVNESFFWVPQMSMADPLFLLPTTAAALIFTVMELGAEMGGAAQTPGIKLVGRVFTLGFIPLTYHFPAALHLYWCSSSLFSLFQTLVFKSPKAREVLGLPALDALSVNKAQKKVTHALTYFEAFRTVRALKPVAK